MNFADIHIHALTGTDDGAEDEQVMYRMVDMAYAEGTRLMCLTPHFHLGYFGDNRESSSQAFEKLCGYARERYPDLELYLGNELRFSPDCGSWLREGLCRTLNRSELLLVDFSAGESARAIIRGLERLMNMGYRPMLAHAERYWELSMSDLHELYTNGVYLQVNAGSLTGKFGWEAKLRARNLIRRRLVTAVSSDAHNDRKRAPKMSRAYRTVCRLSAPEYAQKVFYHNADC